MKTNCFKELPESYKMIKKIDAKDSKTGFLLNLVAVMLSFVFIVSLYYLKGIKISFQNLSSKDVYITFLAFVAVFLYMIMHELVHGLFYKIFTNEKLTFGICFSCAYCGVPSIYVKKKPMLLICLAPFFFFTIIFLLLIILLSANYITFLIIILFGMHFGGCAGDYYCAILLLKYPKDVLVNDTGACQSFYIKK